MKSKFKIKIEFQSVLFSEYGPRISNVHDLDLMQSSTYNLVHAPQKQKKDETEYMVLV